MCSRYAEIHWCPVAFGDFSDHFQLIGPKPTDKTGPGRIYKYAYDQVRKRFSSAEPHSDLLQWIIDHEDKSGDRLGYGMLEQEALNPVFAGSDSVGALLRIMILYTATTPRVLNELLRQIHAADSVGRLSEMPKYEELRQHVPYLEAIMKESLRMYPIVGSPLFRSAPPGGVTIEGHYLPVGTDVAISQWAISRNKAIFGEDADIFRPERWTEELSPEERRVRDIGDVYFSSGYTLCTGRNIALIELNKIIGQLFRQFEVQVADPAHPWKDLNRLAMLQWDFFVTLTSRKAPT